MKDKKNKRIKILSQKIVNLENKIQLGNNVKENEDKINNIMSTLSLEDLLEIDEYITKKKC